ncbi:MAG: RHS repeat domain-containing protein [Pseudomonadota bacterium]
MTRFFGTAAAWGLLATTALTGTAHAQDFVPPAAPPIRETIDANGVDLARGSMLGRTHSVNIGGPGALGLQWSRTVTSDTDWRDSTAIFVSTSGATGIYTVSVGGSSESFTLSGSNYVSNQKTGSTLTLSGSTYAYTTRDGAVYKLDPWENVVKEQYGGTHRVSTITYPTGEKLTFNWEGVDGICIITQKFPNCELRATGVRLASVEATNGYKLQFEFEEPDPALSDSTTGWAQIAKVTALNMSVDPASQTWPTLLIDEGRGVPTAAFTDSLNRTTNYTFTSGLLSGIKRPGAASNSTTVAWSSGKVNQVVNEGVTTNYTYIDLSNVRTTTINDAISGDRVVKTDLTTMLVSSDQDEAGKITSYLYDTNGLLTKVTAPEGNYASFEYDTRGNRTKSTLTPKAGSPLSPIFTQASYPASDATQNWKCASGTPAVTCNKPLTTTDAKANVTNYVWDTTTGALSKVTLPAPAAGGVRPETRYT